MERLNHLDTLFHTCNNGKHIKRDQSNPENCEKCHKPFEDTANNEKMVCLAPDKMGKNVRKVCGGCYQAIVNQLRKSEEQKSDRQNKNNAPIV